VLARTKKKPRPGNESGRGYRAQRHTNEETICTRKKYDLELAASTQVSGASLWRRDARACYG